MAEPKSNHVITCQTQEDRDELPWLPMIISKSRSSQKMLICSLFDTGTSTSILSLDIAKELKIDIKPADHITLRAANGEEMVASGV